MPTFRHHRVPPGNRWLAGSRARCASAVRDAWRAFRRWRQEVPVEVMIADRARRRALERALRRGLRRLCAVLGPDLSAGLAVIVQQVIATDRQLAGCYVVGQRPNGSHFALVRLALQLNGRCLTTDELLAALAEQCIGVLTQHGPSVLVPIDFEPSQATDRQRLTPLRPDPLAPSPHGATAEERTA